MLPIEILGGHLGFLGAQKYERLGNLPNGWTNWHEIWYMSANSSGNGHRLNTIRPSRSHEGIFVVLRGQISEGWERWPNGWTNWDQIVGHIFRWLRVWTQVKTTLAL